MKRPRTKSHCLHCELLYEYKGRRINRGLTSVKLASLGSALGWGAIDILRILLRKSEAIVVQVDTGAGNAEGGELSKGIKSRAFILGIQRHGRRIFATEAVRGSFMSMWDIYVTRHNSL